MLTEYSRISFSEYLKNYEEWSLPGDTSGAAHMSNMGTTPYQSPSIWTGNSNNGEVPQHNIGLPQVNRNGKVVGIDYKSGGNMEVRLDDRTVLRLTHGDVKRIGGDPLLGPDPVTHQPRSELEVVFQRGPGDTSAIVSQVSKLVCKNLPTVKDQYPSSSIGNSAG